MAKKKFYVVWEGKQTGIFDNWDTCKAQIHGHSGAKYKSFPSLALANQAFSEAYEMHKGQPQVFESELTAAELQFIGSPDLKSICVDAACSGNPGLVEYQGVDTETKAVLFKQGPFENGTNNIGEFLALVHALAYLKKNNDFRPIYSDSKIAINWVKKKAAQSAIEKTASNAELLKLIKRAENWLITNDYSNKIKKWETKAWGEIPADFGRK